MPVERVRGVWNCKGYESKDKSFNMEINTTAESGVIRRAGVRKAIHRNLKIDMTPMVDLGFLLIAFFVMTSEMKRKAVTKLNMPKDGPVMPVPLSKSITLLLDGADRVFYYEGIFSDAIKNNGIRQTNFSVKDGIGKIIREKQARLDVGSDTEKRNGLMLMIKPTENASYQSLIDALDETLINDVKKYVVWKADEEEKKWLGIGFEKDK